MFDFMLDAATSIRQVPYETLADKFAVGGEVTLRGMGTVFAVLIMIWGMVEFLHLILGEKKKSPKKKKITTAPIVEGKNIEFLMLFEKGGKSNIELDFVNSL